MVLIDPLVLETLPPHFISDGMGEVIKYGCIKDAELFLILLSLIHISLEEIHKGFSVSILISVMTASVTADYISSYIIGLDPVFQFRLEHVPVSYTHLDVYKRQGERGCLFPGTDQPL